MKKLAAERRCARTGYRGMAAERQLPLPGSPEARAEGCTCPASQPAPERSGVPMTLDRDCPVHGRVAVAEDRAGETGPIDPEGDIADAASEPELRQG